LRAIIHHRLQQPVEILFEIVLQILGWIFQIVAELLLQIVGEAIADLIGHSLKGSDQRSKPTPPFWTALLYLAFGAIAGGISLLLFPNLFIRLEWLRVASLVVTPLLAGLVMAWIGSWLRNRQKSLIPLDSFAYGFCFALGMAFVRHLFAR
jgi:H+/Cl- antiporter ClcA